MQIDCTLAVGIIK